MTKADRERLDKVREGFRRVGLTFPYLVGLIQKIEPCLDKRVETMGIFASGRLAINPQFASSLSAPDLLFVLAHELYHLVLRTHERAVGSDMRAFNCAHDYIINDMLREELQLTRIPADGLDWPGARLLSAEKIMGDIQHYPDLMRGEGDVLDGARERELFPDTQPKEQQARAREVSDQAARAMGLRALMDTLNGKGRGAESGRHEDEVAALRGYYQPPWELALQRWLESAAPSDRSYSRPSRRGADRTDLVLPGRKREGWSLHIVLDTSGSMVEEIPRALGAIADFCAASGVEQVHLIQCDTAVGSDEVLAPAEVARWQVTGYGGSDLAPGMLRLAESPEVQAAIVLTDGEITYPEHAVPYNVLWVLPEWKDASEFTPRYGKVIAMTRKN